MQKALLCSQGYGQEEAVGDVQQQGQPRGEAGLLLRTD